MSEKALYNKMAQVYKDSKLLPWSLRVETFTIFKILGNIEGKTIIDFACGDGFYTRLFKKSGATTVVGVDISTGSIELAEIEERENLLNIEYIIADIGAMDDVGQYDIVTGIYLLDCAKSKEELIDFCEAIYRHLKPGGRFVGYIDSPENLVENYEKYKKYGFYKTIKEERKEGNIITYHITNLDGNEFHDDAYCYSKDTYEKVFRQCGLIELEWCGPWADTSGYDNKFWDDFIKNPPVIAMQAHKP